MDKKELVLKEFYKKIHKYYTNGRLCASECVLFIYIIRIIFLDWFQIIVFLVAYCNFLTYGIGRCFACNSHFAVYFRARIA